MYLYRLRKNCLGIIYSAIKGASSHPINAQLIELMTEDYLQIFNDSYEDCTADPLFLDRFYNKFISSSEIVAEKFKMTNMEDQKNVLLSSLAYMMFANKKPDTLSSIAISHNKNHLDIDPDLYVVWLDCMIEAVRETDSRFGEHTEKAWRITMKPGIDYMIGKYNSP